MGKGVNQGRGVNGRGEKGGWEDHKVPGERGVGECNILSITNGSNDVIIMDISK